MSGRKSKGGRDGVRAGIENAKVVPFRPGAPSGPAMGAERLVGVGSSMARRFRANAEGLFRLSGDADKSDTFVCGPIEALAETRDEEGQNWGVLLRWSDRDGVQHEEAFPRASFAGDGNEVRARLADGGLTLNPAPYARAAFMEWLSGVTSADRARSVLRTGWHQLAGRSVFVLPDGAVGEAGERVVLQAPDREPSLFTEAGTLADWQLYVARQCVGNSRLVLAVSCAFAAPLLGILGEEGGGIHLKGASRAGKSTALRVAASVCGGTAQSGAGGYVRSWRSTSNGIETVAASSCDMLLALDEMGQLDPREAGDVAYLVANGQGKTRASRLGGTRATSRWRVLFLSTGEVGLSDMNREAGKATKAGQEVRFADLPADAGAGLGLFEHLHDADSADEFAKELRAATLRCYGTPLRPYLRRLCDLLERDTADELRTRWRARTEELIVSWLSRWPDASGQVRSVASRFALVALGGEIATELGLTGWAGDVASVSAAVCFVAWLKERGTVGRREDDQAVAQLRDFIARHGESRFDKWLDVQVNEAQQSETPHLPPADRFRTQHRAGWKRWIVETDGDGTGGTWRYYLTAEGMREALVGLNQLDAKATLIERGFLIRDSERSVSGLISPPGHKKVRAYEVVASIMSASEGDR